MISLEEAKERLFASVTPLPLDHLPLLDSFGRFCAETLTARIDLPRFDNSAMDGYAVRSADLRAARDDNPTSLEILGRIGAGEVFAGTITPGHCLRIFTGSVLPQGADAVVMQEDVTAGNGVARFIESVKPLENVRLAGEDVRAGTQLVSVGDRLTATRLALLGATGHGKVPVHKLPRMAVIATGDELVEPGELYQPIGDGKIYESNRALVATLLKPLIPSPTILPLLPDSFEQTVAKLASAFSEHDVVITTGGVSVGEFDFVKDAFTKVGGVLDHWKVAIRPGKPFVFGRLGAKFLFGLPGNPVSTLVTFLVLVRPALLKMMGARDCELPQISGLLAESIVNPGDRRHFVRCRWAGEKVVPSGRQGSHLLGALGGANCLVDVPPATRVEGGTVVTAQLWELPEN